jgi:hypothetical protein
MTEYSGPFESSGSGLQESDWLELEDVAQPYSGIIANYYNLLAVSQHAPLPAMSVDVATGGAIVKSSRYRNDAVKTVTIAAADSSEDRYDLIVVQRTLAAPSSKIIVTTHQGSNYPAGTAVPPSPTQNSTVWELVIAQVFVAHGTLSITTAMITTGSNLASYCGFFTPPAGALAIDPTTGNFVMGGQRVTDMADPENNQDGATQNFVNTLIATVTPWNIFGDADLGDVTISADQNLSGLNQYHNLTINSGKTVTLTGPTIIMATGTVTINGAITGVGKGAAGGVGSNSNSSAGTDAPKPPYSMFNNGQLGGMAAGGRSSTGGATPYTPFPQLGSVFPTAYYTKTLDGVFEIVRLILTGIWGFGEGGGQGGAYSSDSTSTGGSGGPGAPSLIIIAKSIVFATGATITLSGSNGTNGSANGTNAAAGGGGGGNGGLCWFVSRVLTNLGTFISTGGTPGAGASGGIANGTAGYTGIAGALYVISI